MRNSCQKCGTHLPFFPGIKKPRRPRSTGLSNVEAEAGIEPAWADLQAGTTSLYLRTLQGVLRSITLCFPASCSPHSAWARSLVMDPKPSSLQLSDDRKKRQSNTPSTPCPRWHCKPFKHGRHLWRSLQSNSHRYI